MTETEAREALTRWSEAHSQRDSLFRAAYTAGISKYEIHQLTGVARTTIDRILEGDTVTATYPPQVTDAPDMREALTEDLAKYILRAERSPAQVAARAGYLLRGAAVNGYVFTAFDAVQLAAEADEQAGYQRDTNVNWQQWARGQ